MFTDQHPNDTYYEFFRETGVRSSMMCPITNRTGDPVAFLTIDATTKMIGAEELNSYEHFFRDSALRIGGMLSLRASEK